MEEARKLLLHANQWLGLPWRGDGIPVSLWSVKLSITVKHVTGC